jgi:hypothetical protein
MESLPKVDAMKSGAATGIMAQPGWRMAVLHSSGGNQQ